MNRAAPTLILAVFLTAVCPAPCRAAGYSGEDWLRMPKKERLFCVLASIVFLDRYRIRFYDSPQKYSQWMEDMLAQDPRLRRRDVFQVFFQMMCVHDPRFRSRLPELRQAVLSDRIPAAGHLSEGKIG